MAIQYGLHLTTTPGKTKIGPATFEQGSALRVRTDYNIEVWHLSGKGQSAAAKEGKA